MANRKLAFELAAGLSSNVLTQAKYIKAGYIVVQSLAERDALTIKTDSTDGVVVEGTPVYVAGSTNTLYRYLNGNWAKDKTGGAIQTISVNHEAQSIDEIANVDITIPTKTSDITNDGNGTLVEGVTDPFITVSETKAEIAKEIEEYHKNNTVICDEASNTPEGVEWYYYEGTTKITITGTLKATDASNTTLYYVPRIDPNDNDYFDIYKVLGTENPTWNQIGSTKVDISGKQDTLYNGKNTTIGTTTDNKPCVNLNSELIDITSISGGIGKIEFTDSALKVTAGSGIINITNAGLFSITGDVAITGSNFTFNTKTVATQEYIDNKFSYDEETKTLTIA